MPLFTRVSATAIIVSKCVGMYSLQGLSSRTSGVCGVVCVRGCELYLSSDTTAVLPSRPKKNTLGYAWKASGGNTEVRRSVYFTPRGPVENYGGENKPTIQGGPRVLPCHAASMQQQPPPGTTATGTGAIEQPHTRTYACLKSGGKLASQQSPR